MWTKDGKSIYNKKIQPYCCKEFFISDNKWSQFSLWPKATKAPRFWNKGDGNPALPRQTFGLYWICDCGSCDSCIVPSHTLQHDIDMQMTPLSLWLWYIKDDYFKTIFCTKIIPRYFTFFGLIDFRSSFYDHNELSSSSTGQK